MLGRGWTGIENDWYAAPLPLLFLVGHTSGAGEGAGFCSPAADPSARSILSHLGVELGPQRFLLLALGCPGFLVPSTGSLWTLWCGVQDGAELVGEPAHGVALLSAVEAVTAELVVAAVHGLFQVACGPLCGVDADMCQHSANLADVAPNSVRLVVGHLRSEAGQPVDQMGCKTLDWQAPPGRRFFAPFLVGAGFG